MDEAKRHKKREAAKKSDQKVYSAKAVRKRIEFFVKKEIIEPKKK